jgi:L-lactate dehydrogenase complex protein LldG
MTVPELPSSDRSRQAILDRLRSRVLSAPPLPDTAKGPWVAYDDPAQQFETVLSTVGGSCRWFDDRQALEGALREEFKAAGGPTACWLSTGSSGSVDLRGAIDRASLEPLAVVAAEGRLAVAENAAVWVDASLPRLRAALFLAQRMILIVPRSSLVNTMHEAYEQLRISGVGFGIFISGPSKTADIEQSLVIGAHGVRSQQVWLHA